MAKRNKFPTPEQRLPGFKHGFESLPAHYLILTPDFTIINASDIFLRNTTTMRDDIAGRNIFDVFPDNPADPTADGVSNLRASFLRVLERKRLDVVNLIRYDIPRLAAKGGGFEVRYWHPVNFPFFDRQGNLTHIIHNSEDVTQQVLQGKPTRTECA